ncbi:MULTISPECIES: hypothetical protein [Corallococcus]|uniref:hypothetical protein n=1 Tax=Corallococcus TaxID=83461 RepID=UPI00117FE3B0|nr:MULTISPECIES: hypothetical protein [Corallococcus]TSC29311.1 hypothetical protein FOF48_15375 [Corallococcus sp. Z5C101001]
MVEQSFAIERRGLLVVPDVDLGERSQVSLHVALRRPEGGVLHADALAQVPLLSGGARVRHVHHVLCFQTLSKQDVPLGTEVWLLGEAEGS